MTRTISLALLALLAACGPRSGPTTTPNLPDEPVTPGEGKPVEEAPDPDPWSGRTDLLAPPTSPAAPRKVELAAPVRFTLSNGLRVVVVADRRAPMVAYELAIRAGTADESKGKRALADVAAAMLLRGTKTRQADQIFGAIEAAGGSLGASADFESTHVACQVPSSRADVCTTLMADALAAPTFPDAHLADVLDGLGEQIDQIRESPTAFAGEHLENLLWSDKHVRGWPASRDALKSITRKDLVAWHRTWFVPSNAVLVVVGDVDPAGLRADLDKSFAAWKKGKKAPAHKTYPEPKTVAKGPIVRLVDRPDLPQTVILVGSFGLAHGDADFFPFAIVSHALGASAQARLTRAMRANGLEARAAASFERWATRGTFEVSAVSPPSQTLAVVDRIRAELRKMREDGPTADEIAVAIRDITGAYPLGLERYADVAAAVLSAELHALGDDYVREFAARVAAVTQDQTKAAANKRLPSDDVAIVLLGRASDIEPQLTAAKVDYEKVGVLEPISAEERAALAKKKGAPPDPAKTAAGRKLLDQALAAKGGADKLKALKGIHLAGQVTISAGGQTLDGKLERWLQTPSRLRFDVTVFNETISMVVADDQVWQRVGARVQTLPKELVPEALDGIWRDRDLILLRHLEPGTVVQALGTETVGGKDYDVVMVRKADGRAETRILLDRKDHLIFRLVYAEAGASAFEEYGAYQEVQGVKFAFKQHAESPDQSLDVVVKTLELNPTIPAETWKKP